MSKKIAPPGKRGSVKREAFKVDDDESTTPGSLPAAITPPSPAPMPTPPPVVSSDEEIKLRQKEEIMRKQMEIQRQQQLESEEQAKQLSEELRRQKLELEKLQAEKQKVEEEAAIAASIARQQAEREAQAAEKERALAQAKVLEEELRREAEISARQRAIEEEEKKAISEQKRQQEEQIRRKQQEAAAKEAAERQRLAEVAEARQHAEEEAAEAEERHQAELERERVKAAKLAEAQRLKDEEDAEIAEALRRAEEQRRKRQMFLSDMDSFSTQFVSQTQEKENALEDAKRKQNALQANLASLPTAPVDQPRTKKTIAEEDLDDDLRPLKIVEEPLPTSPVIKPSEKEPIRNIVLDASATQSRQEDFTHLSNTLFNSTSNNGNKIEIEEPETKSPSYETSVASTAIDGEELRMPTRIGAGDKAYRPKSSRNIEASTSGKQSASTTINNNTNTGSGKHNSQTNNAASSAAAYEHDEDEEEEEGTGQLDSISNILTREERKRMTREEKASWRAKQVDLNTRRKDFHGAVTYMFDGIFSWQMYGSAEALDEFGNTYTEYLMRCQWGTSFENLQPWIVAHRYREFDKLDQELKKRFPALEITMPKLPKKEFFWSMETQVVTKRRQALEDYMVKLVQSFPTLLRSDLMDVFLHITERIHSIKMLLKVAPSLNMTTNASSSSSASAAATTGTQQGMTTQPQRAVDAYEAAAESAVVLNSAPHSHFSSSSDPLGANAVSNNSNNRRGSGTGRGGGGPVVMVDEEEAQKNSFSTKILYWSVDEADRAKDELHSRPLDEDGLGQVEEDIRSLFMLFKKTPAKEIVRKDSDVRRLLASINHRWPALRATCVVNMEVDFILIPRAMQAEEDYLRCLNEFRNLDMLQGYNV